MKKLMVALCALALTGCATKYGEMNLTGGVTAQQMTSDTYRIIARGNGYTNPVTVKDFSMLKAAETTIAAGKRYFAVVDKNDATDTSYTTTYSRYLGAETYSTQKPGEDLYIRILPSKTPNAIDATEIVKFVGERVKPKEEPQFVEKPKA